MKPIQRKMAALGLAVGTLLFLGGCATMAPKYTQPTAPVSAAWPNGDSYQKGGTDTAAEKRTADIPWQQFFVDEQLRKPAGGGDRYGSAPAR